MRTEKEILELRARVYTSMQDVLKRAATERRAMTSDEDEQWTKANAEFDSLTKEIERVRLMAELDNTTEPEPSPIPGVHRAQDPEREAVRSYMKGLLENTRSEAEIERLKKSSPTRAVTSKGAGNGSFVVAEEFMRMIEVFLKSFSGMFDAARKHESAKGGTMRWPTIDDTASTGQWVAQPRVGAVTPRRYDFNRKTFNDHTWTDVLALEWEFLQDEDVMFVSEVMAELVGASYGRALNYACTRGNGTGTPTGLLDASGGASTGKTAASATAFTKAELIDLMHSVDPAYRQAPTTAWMLHDSVLSYVRKLDFGTTDTVPLWQPSFREGMPDTILGKPYWINQDMPSALATGQKTVAFGDFSKYVVRNVRSLSIVRLDERYADSLATGFVAWSRVDGLLINQSAIKLLVQA